MGRSCSTDQLSGSSGLWRPGKWGNSRLGNLGYSYCFVEGSHEVYLLCQGIHLGPQIHLVHTGSIRILEW